MTTLSNGTETIIPYEVVGYESATEARNIFHNIIGRASDDVSLSDDSLRAGTLELLFTDRAEAWAAHALLVLPDVWTLTDADVPEIGMTFVRAGGMSIVLEDETRLLWLLRVGFQEVGS